MNWQDQAACRGIESDLFFPERGVSHLDAVNVCLACPVRAQCFVVNVDERFGVWGGASERVRRQFRGQHRPLIAAAHVALGIPDKVRGKHSVAEQMLRYAA